MLGNFDDSLQQPVVFGTPLEFMTYLLQTTVDVNLSV